MKRGLGGAVGVGFEPRDTNTVDRTDVDDAGCATGSAKIHECIARAETHQDQPKDRPRTSWRAVKRGALGRASE
jgi:hypothetical protein